MREVAQEREFLFGSSHYCNNGTVVLQKVIHGQSTLQVSQRGGGHSFKCFHIYNHERVPMSCSQ